ncbi:vomeronasal type-1 receptor 90-like [Cricetulus griseus]|uniref:Vomeronasal type-1 receptor n=1 Tax=Cricetulus griseus TaxID=10029 RepID=A0A061I3T8_CRIGR|nr:vomeronasal type-1 receptor 90-like [Cricetulus griseus]XP_027274857.1 vomeronasal type-1 receptor 90-like [Cricetulus griseus]ERE73357.1 vomeronasal type-1 receptor A16-like protein [Cricetulus griseus]
MNRNNPLYNNNGIRNAFFSQIAFGILANTILLLFLVMTLFQEHRHKPANMITGLLALSHIVMLLTMAFMATDILGSQSFWEDFTCRSVISLYRLMRSVSICATCHLSILQAVILSPRSSCLSKFKHKSLHHNSCCFLSLWSFYMSISGYMSFIVATPNVTSHILILITKSCSLWLFSGLIRHLLCVLAVVRDAVLVGLMALSSVYVVAVLCRHKRQSQYLHSASISPRASPEQRAICIILVLLSFFVVMYCLDCIAFSLRSMWNNDPTHHCVQMFVSSGYATLSPLVFISTEQHIINFLKTMQGGQ